MAEDLDSLRTDKRSLHHLVEQLKQENRELGERLRERAGELQSSAMEADRCRLQLQETQARVEDLRGEIGELKAEKSRAAHKADLLDDENSNLRKEIFMLKKLMLEYDRREMQAERIHTVAGGPRPLGDPRDYSGRSSPQADPHPGREEANRERGPRYNSANDLRAIYLLNAAREAQPPPAPHPDPPRHSSPRLPRAVHQPEAGGSANILTWNNPYEGSGGLSSGPRPPRAQAERQRAAAQRSAGRPGSPAAGRLVQRSQARRFFAARQSLRRRRAQSLDGFGRQETRLALLLAARSPAQPAGPRASQAPTQACQPVASTDA